MITNNFVKSYWLCAISCVEDWMLELCTLVLCRPL